MKKNVAIGVFVLAVLIFSLVIFFFFVWEKKDIPRWYTAGTWTTDIVNASWSAF